MITVQLTAGGPITEMDEALLERRAGTDNHENATVEWVEYWLPSTTDRAVHRSIHVTMKHGLNLENVQGQIG